MQRVALACTATDSLVVLSNGEIVFEHYARGNTASDRHILMSSSKAIVGLLFEILAADGLLDLNATASKYVGEIEPTPYKGATLRQLLDMQAGVRLDSGQARDYDSACGWDPLFNGSSPDLKSFFARLRGEAKSHDGAFHYVSANYDLLGWVLERAAGQSVATVLAEKLWKPMGAESSAYITVDPGGLARCTGGICATPRDFARVGQLLVDRGRAGSVQVFPSSIIDGITTDGDAQAWANGEWGQSFKPIAKKMRYRSGWYNVESDNPYLFAMGIHGQNLFIDFSRRIVVAKLSSWAKPIERFPLWATHKGFEKFQSALPQRHVGTASARPA